MGDVNKRRCTLLDLAWRLQINQAAEALLRTWWEWIARSGGATSGSLLRLIFLFVAGTYRPPFCLGWLAVGPLAPGWPAKKHPIMAAGRRALHPAKAVRRWGVQNKTEPRGATVYRRIAVFPAHSWSIA